MLEQPRAGLGRLDRPARQQHRAEVGLQHADVLGDRRLRVAELARGAARTSRGGRRSRRSAGSAGPSGSLIRLPQKIVGRDRRAARACRPWQPRSSPSSGTARPSVRAHGRIPLLIDALRRRDGLVLDPYWIPSTEADDLDGFDGIWVVPGSPYTRPGEGRRRRQDRARARDPVPRHLRRLPARDPRARARPGGHRGRRTTPSTAIDRRHRRDRGAGVLARRPRGPDPLHARAR